MTNAVHWKSAKRSPIRLLTGAAIVALVFTIMGGGLFYSNANRLRVAEKWVEHTEEVLVSVHQAVLLVEEIHGAARVYEFTHKPASRAEIQQAARLFQASAFHLQRLVSDNSSQNENVALLSTCSALLVWNLGSVDSEVQASYTTINDCKRALGRIEDQEQDLLRMRKQRSQQDETAILRTAISFGLISIVTMSVLFTMLTRETLSRTAQGVATARSNETLRYSLQTLENNVEESGILSSYRDDLLLCTELSQIYASAGHYLTTLLPGCSGTVCIINSSRNLLEEVLQWGDFLGEAHGLAVFHPDSCCGLRAGKPRWRHPGRTEIDCEHFEGPPPFRYLCVPMSAQGETLGVLHIACEDEIVFRALEQRLNGMHQVVQLTGISIAAVTLRSKLERQSLRDPLTQLFNRHFMEVVLKREILRAQRKSTGLAVMMLDIDYFKRFNDQYGHLAGDAMLQGVAALFQGIVRGDDTICRFGGEEFVIILPDIEAEVAFRRAELIRKAVEDAAVPLPNGIIGRATLSIGLALHPVDGESMEGLLSRADQALYRSKRNGRNQVSLADHVPLERT